MKTSNPTPKAKTCAVNRERWARLIPDQPECSKPTSRPAAALCPKHEKMLPSGWRKLDAARPRATKAEPKPKAALKAKAP